MHSGLATEEIVRKARAEQAAKRDHAGVKQEEKELSLEKEKPKKSSYFDDAGDEKYRCLAFSFLLCHVCHV